MDDIVKDIDELLAGCPSPIMASFALGVVMGIYWFVLWMAG